MRTPDAFASYTYCRYFGKVAVMARSSVLGNATRVEPGPADQASASSLSQALTGAVRLLLLLPNGQEIELPQALIKILKSSADQLSAGHVVMILASEALLTPAEVGELLGLSRPYIVRLLDRGVIPSDFLPDSRHRVVRLADVLEFQARRERRREGRRRINEVIESEDLPY